MDLSQHCVNTRQSLETIYQTPRGHLPHQSNNRPPQKLASRYTWRQSRKCRRRGAMVTLTQRRVQEQASTLVRTISSHCQVRIKGNQASSEPLPFGVGCTARNISTWISQLTCDCLFRKIYYPQKFLRLQYVLFMEHRKYCTYVLHTVYSTALKFDWNLLNKSTWLQWLLTST